MPFMIQLAICTFASLRVERGWLKSLAAFTFVALTADEPGGVTFIGKKKGANPKPSNKKPRRSGVFQAMVGVARIELATPTMST